MSALDLTRGDLMRALGSIAAWPAVDAAVRARAEAVAGSIAARADAAGIAAETTVRVLRQAPGDYAVAVSAPGLFAREFGAIDAPADPLVGAALAEATR